MWSQSEKERSNGRNHYTCNLKKKRESTGGNSGKQKLILYLSKGAFASKDKL